MCIRNFLKKTQKNIHYVLTKDIHARMILIAKLHKRKKVLIETGAHTALLITCMHLSLLS